MTKKIKSFLVAMALVASILLPATARATSEEILPENPEPDYGPTEDQLGYISDNCASIKLQLQRVQRADAKSRVHLGVQYETISSNLMLNLNLRLVKNNLANAELAGQQTAFFSERERFKNDFIGYSQQFEKLLQIDCREKPKKFYDQLTTVRQKRADIQQSIYRLNGLIDEHRATVEALKESL